MDKLSQKIVPFDEKRELRLRIPDPKLVSLEEIALNPQILPHWSDGQKIYFIRERIIPEQERKRRRKTPEQRFMDLFGFEDPREPGKNDIGEAWELLIALKHGMDIDNVHPDAAKTYGVRPSVLKRAVRMTVVEELADNCYGVIALDESMLPSIFEIGRRLGFKPNQVLDEAILKMTYRTINQSKSPLKEEHKTEGYLRSIYYGRMNLQKAWEETVRYIDRYAIIPPANGVIPFKK